MKIFVYNLREYDEKVYFDLFCKKNECEYGYTPEYPSLNNADLAKGYDALDIINSRMDAELLERFHEIGIKYIATRSIGYEHIDLKKAQSLGMRIAHVFYSPNSVANYTVMLMLMGCRNIAHVMERARIQDFTLQGKMGREISNCTVGVIGTGKIGSTVIKHLSGFGCNIYAYDDRPDEFVRNYAEYTELDRLIKECDIITLHAPSNNSTYHMITKETIETMKDGVIIINTARGSLVDTAALIDGLDSRKIGFAALDVLENEEGLYYLNRMNEVIGNHELAILSSYPNVILTPHTAFYTDEAVSNMVENSINGICGFEKDEVNMFEVK
ncbi:MAG: D-isomer specific 2-hydroxyacid dehydrogenase family protein [Lachnospiraceae bacterium]|nr:D-isomer specific 2-hydroxyacid dehydrogenase family protein [Lachnospiraceae bacterium]